VADTGNHRVQELDPDGRPLAARGGVHFPHGIAVDSQDDVYVSDSAGLRKFGPNGDLVADWTGSGLFGDPYGLAIDDAGTIFVADTDNGRIAAVSPTGDVQATWGSPAKALGQLTYPRPSRSTIRACFTLPTAATTAARCSSGARSLIRSEHVRRTGGSARGGPWRRGSHAPRPADQVFDRDTGSDRAGSSCALAALRGAVVAAT
jgi:hypothetical protein